MNIIKSTTNSSIFVQWDAVDDFLLTAYAIIWFDTRDLYGVYIATVDEQTSYTITGLTLDTVYTITITAANKCGSGPEFRTSIFFSPFTASTIVTTTAVTHPTTTTTTTTAMINTTTSIHMTTMFGITTKTTKNLCVTATTTKGFSIL